MYDFTLKGLFNEDIDTVFQAFYDPEVISKWFAPGALRVSRFLSTFEEGGQYQAVMQSPDGFQQTVVGTYQKIENNDTLSFTWRWDDTNDVTKVHIHFAQLPNSSTKVILTQSGFHQEQDMIHQQYGWMACLEKLSIAMNDVSKCRKLAA